jgi:hypothetical protein
MCRQLPAHDQKKKSTEGQLEEVTLGEFQRMKDKNHDVVRLHQLILLNAISASMLWWLNIENTDFQPKICLTAASMPFEARLFCRERGDTAANMPQMLGGPTMARSGVKPRMRETWHNYGRKTIQVLLYCSFSVF